MTTNKDMVIESLVERFSGDRVEANLIRASCENIYQWGRLRGVNETLEKMRGEFIKGKEILP